MALVGSRPKQSLAKRPCEQTFVDISHVSINHQFLCVKANLQVTRKEVDMLSPPFYPGNLIDIFNRSQSNKILCGYNFERYGTRRVNKRQESRVYSSKYSLTFLNNELKKRQETIDRNTASHQTSHVTSYVSQITRNCEES